MRLQDSPKRNSKDMAEVETAPPVGGDSSTAAPPPPPPALEVVYCGGKLLAFYYSFCRAMTGELLLFAALMLTCGNSL